MRFLSPGLLWFLAAAALPVLIHLINRRRHRTVYWAAMQFLLKAARQSRGKKKLRHILILTMRTLAVAALALAAAQPIMSHLLGWGGGAIDTVVLVLDRSASMEVKSGVDSKSRRQMILEQVRDGMAGLGSARLVLIDSVSGQAQEVASPEILDELSVAGPSDSAADFPELLTRAAEYLAESQGRSEVWLASDLQASNWQVRNERWAAAHAALASLPRQPAIRVLGLSGPTAVNASIRLLGMRRNGDELLLELELSRAGDARGIITLPVTTHLNGSHTTETLTIPGQTLRFHKRLALAAGSREAHGWISIPADGNLRDNNAYFASPEARPVASLVVAEPNESARYLQLAVAPPGWGGRKCLRVNPADAAAAIDAQTAAIFWAAPLPTGKSAAAVDAFLARGGQVLFLPPEQASDTAFHGLRWSERQLAAAGKFLILGDWNHTDGPLRDGLDGTPIAAKRLKSIRRHIPLGDATPLARWDDGQTALARLVVDRGTAWFLGTSPDYAWSNLGDADVLLPVVQRIIEVGTDQLQPSSLTEVGAAPTSLRQGEIRQRLDDAQRAERVTDEGAAGVFRMGERLMAINRPLAEDDPEVIGRDELAVALAGTRFTLWDQAGQADEPSLAREVWRGFLVAMLLFLIVEAWLCLPKRDHAAASTRPANATPDVG